MWAVERGDEAMGWSRSLVVRLWIQVLEMHQEMDISWDFFNIVFPGLILFSLPNSLGCRPVWVDLHRGQAEQGNGHQLGAQLSGLQDAPVLLCGYKQPPQWPCGPLAENRSAKHHS